MLAEGPPEIFIAPMRCNGFSASDLFFFDTTKNLIYRQKAVWQHFSSTHSGRSFGQHRASG